METRGKQGSKPGRQSKKANKSKGAGRKSKVQKDHAEVQNRQVTGFRSQANRIYRLEFKGIKQLSNFDNLVEEHWVWAGGERLMKE